ncbi:MAG: hypothetical protein JO060_05665 [Candidatus Eremiobacteraeota bacterium]|nr:hypothetical protein [Candidatus Eremiobacteraeota bacterium]MBV9646419.1 hypothetical protein [Candidatus Eremiobacteraeota bacterium]
MRNLTLAPLFAFALALGTPAYGMDSMSSMMPSCPPSDPVVGVNMMTKTYMTHDQMKAKSSGMTMAQKEAMMKKNHVKLMCKSKADAMGAKMMKSSMMKSSM